MKLPKGLSIANGYLRIRVFHRGIVVEDTTLGQATPKAIDDAQIYLSRIREKIRANRLNMPIKEREMKFPQVVKVFFDLWKEVRDPNGKIEHDAKAIANWRTVIDNQIMPHFESYYFDQIRPKHVMSWREKTLARGVGGTTANKYQAVLSSIFSYIDTWSKLETIDPIKRPADNPCTPVEKAPMVKRERVLSPYEFQKLKNAFRKLGDFDGEQISIYMVSTCLSEADLRSLKMGQTFDSKRQKSGVSVSVPITILTQLNWTNWRKRWNNARVEAGLGDLQPRDLRKTGLNWAKGHFDNKLISEYAGHASVKTTERNYLVKQNERMLPIAEYLLELAKK